jgi:hypothetical protein
MLAVFLSNASEPHLKVTKIFIQKGRYKSMKELTKRKERRKEGKQKGIQEKENKQSQGNYTTERN